MSNAKASIILGFRSTERRLAAAADQPRTRSRSEAGFTLIEILVVMLILGALAAIAIPLFFNQTSKSKDASAKAQVRAMATAIETCRTESSSDTYAGCDLSRLRVIEFTIPSNATVLVANDEGYEIQSAPAADTNNLFRILRLDGQTTRECTIGSGGDTGACDLGGQEPNPGTEGAW